MIRAVAWDIDGTLVDSEPLHESVLVEVCSAHCENAERFGDGRFRGIHMGDVWRAVGPHLGGAVTEAEWNARIVDAYVAGAAALVEIPGALGAMRALDAARIPQVCVSNSCRRIVDANLAALGVSDLLRFSLALEDVPNGKPDPAPYAMAAERLGLPPAEVAAIEDSATGVASARAAGLRVFALSPDGSLSAADACVASLAEIAPLVLSGRMNAKGA